MDDYGNKQRSGGVGLVPEGGGERRQGQGTFSCLGTVPVSLRGPRDHLWRRPLLRVPVLPGRRRVDLHNADASRRYL